MADLKHPEQQPKPRATKSIPCSRCGKGKQYDSNGLCIRCNFNKMMGGEVV